jgi:hypothetical protein
MVKNLLPVSLRGTEKGFVTMEENRNYATLSTTSSEYCTSV